MFEVFEMRLSPFTFSRLELYFSFFFGRQPCYVTADPAVVRDVCTKNFSNFVNRNVVSCENGIDKFK